MVAAPLKVGCDLVEGLDDTARTISGITERRHERPFRQTIETDGTGSVHPAQSRQQATGTGPVRRIPLAGNSVLRPGECGYRSPGTDQEARP